MKIDKNAQAADAEEKNGTISEESFTEEDLSGDDVQNFLKELGPETGPGYGPNVVN